MSGLFLEQKGAADQFRFGREADGTPAAPSAGKTWRFGAPHIASSFSQK